MSRSSLLLPLLLPAMLATMLAACTDDVDPASLEHFDPPGDSTLTGLSPVVNIINLDEEPQLCYTLDGSEPLWGDDCANTLQGGERAVPMPCGFVVLTIAWDEGRQTDQANYLVDADDCEVPDGPVVLWSNDELVWAMVGIKDELQCRMNNCENPSGTGHWSTDCGDGQVDWDVSLNGLAVTSEFTYTNCTASTEITVHDYEADPWFQDEAATLPMTVTLTLDGVFSQDVDFGGNGSERGTVNVVGDFNGRVESRIDITDEARSAGGFAAGCDTDPLDDEMCAPGGAMILYDFPDWSCHDNICPEPGDEPPEFDADADGIADEDDNCPDDVNPLQEDLDEDGIGDACDPEVGFVLVQFKHGERCLILGAGDVSSTSECDPTDRLQQWEMQEESGFLKLVSRANGDCLSQDGWGLGPWSVIAEECAAGEAKQQWALEDYDQGGFDERWPHRMKNQADNFCIYTDNTGLVYGTISNCGLAGSDAGRKMGLYPGGAFEAGPVGM